MTTLTDQERQDLESVAEACINWTPGNYGLKVPADELARWEPLCDRGLIGRTCPPYCGKVMTIVATPDGLKAVGRSWDETFNNKLKPKEV